MSVADANAPLPPAMSDALELGFAPPLLPPFPVHSGMKIKATITMATPSAASRSGWLLFLSSCARSRG